MDKAHLWPLRCDQNRLGIGRTILLALHKWAHVSGCDQLNNAPQFIGATGPVVRATTSRHHNHGRFML